LALVQMFSENLIATIRASRVLRVHRHSTPLERSTQANDQPAKQESR